MEPGQGCVKPAAGPLQAAATQTTTAQPTREVPSMSMPLVGHQAPDFEANVFLNGGFETMKLSDYKGKWIVLCFYPGDFTFV